MSQAHADAQWDIQPERRRCAPSHFFQGDCGVFLQSQEQQQQLGNAIDPTQLVISSLLWRLLVRTVLCLLDGVCAAACVNWCGLLNYTEAKWKLRNLHILFSWAGVHVFLCIIIIIIQTIMIQQCAQGPNISRALHSQKVMLGFWEQFQSAVKMHYNIYSYLTSSKLLNAHVQLLSVYWITYCSLTSRLTTKITNTSVWWPPSVLVEGQFVFKTLFSIVCLSRRNNQCMPQFKQAIA